METSTVHNKIVWELIYLVFGDYLVFEVMHESLLVENSCFSAT